MTARARQARKEQLEKEAEANFRFYAEEEPTCEKCGRPLPTEESACICQIEEDETRRQFGKERQ